jgi:hypothetical protein
MAPLDKLAPPLRHILKKELAAGNEIMEIVANPGWPPDCELFIALKRKFSRMHDMPSEVTFNQIDDYHYWFADYNYNGSQQLLTCQFAPPIPGFELFLTKLGRIFAR